MKYRIRHITLLLFIVLLSSCSSSRIGKDENDTLSAEQSFMQINFRTSGIKEWEQGKEFICVTEELPTLLEPRKGIRDDYSNLKGDKFRYKYVEENTTWKGLETYIVYENNYSEFLYKISKQAEEIISSNFIPLLPELVSVEEILKADSLLKGTTIYIKISNWYKIDGEEVVGKRLIPVTVQRVKEGNKIFPLSIIFKTDEDKEYMVYTSMNGTQYSTFDKLFTFSDPRQKYPQIKDEIWELIIQSKVELGMTKNECQISLGLPDEVSQIPEYSGLRERWMYKSGSYLEFKDGLLIKFRLM